MDTNMKQQDSMNIIKDMMLTAREEYSAGAAYYFVLWGIIMMIYSIINYIGLSTGNGWESWSTILFAIGGILSFIKSKQTDKTENAVGRHDRLYMFVWGGVGACLAVTWGLGTVLGVNAIIPVTLMLYALASFITGGTTKYTPSIVGSIICMLFAVAAMFLNFAMQNLVCAAAVLFVHVIPGLMMKSFYKQRTNA